MVTAHGKRAIKGKISGPINDDSGRDPNSVDWNPPCISIMCSRRGSWGVLGENSIGEAQGREPSGKFTRSDICVVVNPDDNVIAGVQSGGYRRKKIRIENGTRVRRGNALELEVA